ncbi:MAG: hypothetical protein WDO70_02460 [Alphaproteobacteria bacterium]
MALTKSMRTTLAAGAIGAFAALGAGAVSLYASGAAQIRTPADDPDFGYGLVINGQGHDNLRIFPYAPYAGGVRGQGTTATIAGEGLGYAVNVGVACYQAPTRPVGFPCEPEISINRLSPKPP